jgi:Esterase-like activity of phytase
VEIQGNHAHAPVLGATVLNRVPLGAEQVRNEGVHTSVPPSDRSAIRQMPQSRFEDGLCDTPGKQRYGPEPNTRADKIGDAVSLGYGEFLVLERDDDALPDDNPAHIEKKIYRFNLTGATDVSALTGAVGSTGKTVDQLSIAEMVANGIQPIAKNLHVDLNQAGWNRNRDGGRKHSRVHRSRAHRRCGGVRYHRSS